MVSEKMYENGDGQMPESLVYYKITHEPLAGVSKQLSACLERSTGNMAFGALSVHMSTY